MTKKCIRCGDDFEIRAKKPHLSTASYCYKCRGVIKGVQIPKRSLIQPDCWDAPKRTPRIFKGVEG